MIIAGHQLTEAPDALWVTVAAAIVGFVAAVLGWFLNLDYSAKLFVMTFILVIMGANQASGGCCTSCLSVYRRHTQLCY